MYVAAAAFYFISQQKTKLRSYQLYIEVHHRTSSADSTERAQDTEADDYNYEGLK